MDPSPPDAVLDHVPSHADIVVPMANGEPVALLDVLEREHRRLTGVRIHQMHALHDAVSARRCGDHLRHVSYFLSAVTRPAYWEGQIDLVPNHFSEVPQLLRDSTRCSLVVAAASMPDAHGYFSLGTNAEYVASLIGRAPFFLEANPQMPRTFGLNQIHVSQVVGWCESSRPLVEVPPVAPNERDLRIAAAVVEHIPDRATLQIGIGGIPNALLASLTEHRDLGIHTELLSDGIIDLVDRGVITGTHKQLRRHKIVATFALGTQRLYDWMDDNGVSRCCRSLRERSPHRRPRRDFGSIKRSTEARPVGVRDRPWRPYWSRAAGGRTSRASSTPRAASVHRAAVDHVEGRSSASWAACDR